MRVRAHAKINWTLEVLGKRPDGYHDLRSIVLPVALHDVVDLEPADGITCETKGLDIPQEKNLAYRAALALQKATGCTQGVRISIEKHIPSGAGLGGGSSDAAAVLNALNVLWHLDLPCERLCEIAAEQGTRTELVSGPEAVTPELLRGANCVGIASGASAPDALVRGIHDAVKRIAETQ